MASISSITSKLPSENQPIRLSALRETIYFLILENRINLKDLLNLSLVSRNWKTAVKSDVRIQNIFTLMFVKYCGLDIFTIDWKRGGGKPPSFLDKGLRSIPLYKSLFESFVKISKRAQDIDGNWSFVLENIAKAEAEMGDLKNSLVDLVLEELKTASRSRDWYAYKSMTKGIAEARVILGDFDKALDPVEKSHHRAMIYCKIAECKAKNPNVKTEELSELLTKAKQELRSTKKKEKKREVFYKIAEIQVQIGDIRGAKLTLSDIKDPTDETGNILKKMIEKQAELGDFEGARATQKEFSRILDSDEVLFAIAIQKAKNGDSKGALSTMDAVSEWNSRKDYPYYRIGCEQIKNKDFEGLKSTIEKLQNNDFYKSELLFSQAKIKFSKGEIEEGRTLLQEATRFAEKNNQSNASIDIALFQAERGNMEEALRIIGKYIGRPFEPNVSRAMEKIIALCVSQNKPEQIKLVKSLVDKESIDSRVALLIDIANAEMRLGLPDAKETLKKACSDALKSDSRDKTKLLVDIAIAQNYLNHREEAKLTLAQAKRLQEDSKNYLDGRISSLLKIAIGQAAICDLKEANETIELTKTLVQQVDYQRKDSVQRSIAITSACVLMEAGNFKDAVKEIKKAKQQRFEMIEGLNQLVAFYSDRNLRNVSAESRY